MSLDGTCVGIDIGSSKCCVGVWVSDAERVRIIPNDYANRTTPSYVTFHAEDSGTTIGDAAKNHSPVTLDSTVFSTQRLIGRRYYDPDVQADIKQWPFKVSKDLRIETKHGGLERKVSPEEVCALLIQYMKQVAEDFLGVEVKHAVISVSCVAQAWHESIIKACSLANLNLLRIQNSAISAAVCYAVTKPFHDEHAVIILDLGASSCNVSLVVLEEDIVEEKAIAVDPNLGGDDFDYRMVDYFTQDIKRRFRKDISSNTVARHRLRLACERAKHTLSYITVARIDVEALVDGIDYSATITRARFEGLCSDYFKRVVDLLEKVLRDARMAKVHIRTVLLVGGSTRIPRIKALVSDFFDGNAVVESIKNPDEDVAYGAAVQGAILSGSAMSYSLREIFAMSVLPLSLGFEAADGAMTAMIKRHSTIPAKKTLSFSTYHDNQSAILIQVFEGERSMARDNVFLGDVKLSGIPPMPRGEPQIDVCFDVDANARFLVSAIEKSTGKEVKDFVRYSIDNKLPSDEEREAMSIWAFFPMGGPRARNNQNDPKLPNENDEIEQSSESNEVTSENIAEAWTFDKAEYNELRAFLGACEHDKAENKNNETTLEFLCLWQEELKSVAFTEALSKQEKTEKLAIANSQDHGEFYTFLVTRIRSIVFACESLMSGMIAARRKNLKDYAVTLVQRGFKAARKDIDVVEFMASTAKMVLDLSAAPGSSAISWLVELLAAMKSEHDQQDGLTRVVFFAAKAQIVEGSNGVNVVIERIARYLVRARCVAPNKYGHEKKKFGRFKKAALRLLTSQDITPQRELAHLAALDIISSIMQPEKGSELFCALESSTIADDGSTKFHILLLTELFMGIQPALDCSKLPPFSPNSTTPPSSSDVTRENSESDQRPVQSSSVDYSGSPRPPSGARSENSGSDQKPVQITLGIPIDDSGSPTTDEADYTETEVASSQESFDVIDEIEHLKKKLTELKWGREKLVGLEDVITDLRENESQVKSLQKKMETMTKTRQRSHWKGSPGASHTQMYADPLSEKSAQKRLEELELGSEAVKQNQTVHANEIEILREQQMIHDRELHDVESKLLDMKTESKRKVIEVSEWCADMNTYIEVHAEEIHLLRESNIEKDAKMAELEARLAQIEEKKSKKRWWRRRGKS